MSPTPSNYKDAKLIEVMGEEGLIAADYELQRAYENINDPNKQADATRTVTIKIKLKPNADRSAAAATILCDSNLQPDMPKANTIYMGKGNKAYVHKLQQGELEQMMESVEETQTGSLVQMLPRK